MNHREVMDLEIHKENPWGFFDGAAQNDLCGGGALLFLSDTHFFELTFGLGEGTNNFVEFVSLKLLLIFAIEQGCRTINFFGDSMNVINWKRGIHQCRNLRLANLLSSTREVLHGFDSFSCRHVYRENNQKVDQASKEGLQMAMGTWKVKEFREGMTQEYYHRPFID